MYNFPNSTHNPLRKGRGITSYSFSFSLGLGCPMMGCGIQSVRIQTVYWLYLSGTKYTTTLKMSNNKLHFSETIN